LLCFALTELLKHNDTRELNPADSELEHSARGDEF